MTEGSSSDVSETADSVWPGGGKNEFINLGKSCKLLTEESKLRVIFYDVCRMVLSNKLTVDQVVSALKEISHANPGATSTLADILHICDIECQAEQLNNKKKIALAHLVSAVNETAVSDVLLKERLDYDLLGDANVIPNKGNAKTRLIKLKTRLFYKQQKFNLLREECEGYAKLITELNQDSKSFDVSYMLQVIRSLIGCFNLDPNRVLDIILESFERKPFMESSFIPLIQRFLDNSSSLTQLIAFKFSFYHDDKTPESLYFITAILLTHRLIDLNDLFSYLSPKDSLIEEHYNYEIEEAKLLARRATIVSTTEEKPKEEKFNETQKFSLLVNNQKVGLCIALLKVGNWKAAESVMNLLPEGYCFMNQKVCYYVCNLISIGIDQVYREHSGLPKTIAFKLKSLPTGDVRYFEPVKSVDDFVEKVYPIIRYIGPFICADTLLINKLIRIFKVLLRKSQRTPVSKIKSREATPSAVEPGEDMDDARIDENSMDCFEDGGGGDGGDFRLNDDVRAVIINILDESILPGISMVESNCGLSELLKLLPYETRYRLYHGWSKPPTNALLLKKRAATLKQIKYIMKRLSKENVKQTGRKIGKLSHSNPSFLFDNILSQIQTYDNLIGPVVDSFRFLTTISFDVLIYAVIEILADTSKGKTKHDGASLSPWIMSLANFCGSVVKKYPVQLPGLFQFIANQLKDEKSLDLLILKEIVSKMAGIEATDQMTNDQLAALSGGELLRQEGGYFIQVRNTRKSSLRLKEALMENNLAMPLCMLMAQQTNCILYKEQEHSHLKLVGKLYDQCQETLVQFGAFLSNNLSIDDYSGTLPSLSKLLSEYNLSTDVAFFLSRPLISHRIAVRYEELRKARSGPEQARAFIDAYEEVTEALVDAVKPAMRSRLWDDLTPRFFVTFWTSTMYDLEVPKGSYDRETDKLKQQIQQIEENGNIPPAKKKKDAERTRLLLEKLLEEQLRQDQHVGRIRQRLEIEKDHWFLSQIQKMEMTTQFFQYCLFPRCIFTASDALFCAKFIHILHTLKTPNFSTLICYDRIFCDISYTMSSCTENEANHYGRFLCALLETVMRWHKDKKLFESECAKYPGFITKFHDTNPSYVDYEDYRHVCHKWHYRLTKAVILCLDSDDYIQIRNSLLVLTKIIPHFPVIKNFASAIEKRVELLRTKEKDNRKDLYALATGYIGQLKSKTPYLIPEELFHQKDVKTGQPTQQNDTKKEVKKEKDDKKVDTKKEKDRVDVNSKREKIVEVKKEVKKESESPKSNAQDRKPRDSKDRKLESSTTSTKSVTDSVKIKTEPMSPRRETPSSTRKLSTNEENDRDVKRRKTTHQSNDGNKVKDVFEKPRDSRDRKIESTPTSSRSSVDNLKVKSEPMSPRREARRLSPPEENDREVKRRKTTHQADGTKGKDLYEMLYPKQDDHRSEKQRHRSHESSSNIEQRNGKDKPKPSYSSSSDNKRYSRADGRSDKY